MEDYIFSVPDEVFTNPILNRGLLVFNQLFGTADDVFFCRLNSLREDLVAFFDTIGVATDELRDYVLRLDKKNTSERSHESIFYTADLAELVRIRDRALVERFEFTFEGSVSKDRGNAAA